MLHKLGCLPAQRPHGLADLTTYVKGKLPTPPTQIPVPKVAHWGMDQNDQYGDCTIAGVAHLIAAWDAEVGASDAVPDSADVGAEYKALTGCVVAGDAHDTGMVEAIVLATWHQKGLFGTQIAAYAPVDTSSVLALHQAIAAYGGVYVGVALPQSAETQFANGEPWVLVGDPAVGGHCIVFVGYDSSYLYAITWGGVARVSWAWWAFYGTEAWAIIPQAFVETGRGPEVALDELRADLPSLQMSSVCVPVAA